jgi:hypothetical protein
MPRLPPPEMPARTKPRDIPEMLVALQDELNKAARAAAGYFTLSSIYEQVTALAKGKSRKKGLPIFQYKGSLDGVNVLPLECDLGKIPTEFLPHMLSPMCNVHAAEMLEGLSNMQTLVDDAVGMLRLALGVSATIPKGLEGGEEPVEDDEAEEGEEVTD